ncbi:hypothetical protein [Brachyspira pilosicoli]|nr:hypothetical protein [Brachyspira pilosicoli]SUW01016.1 Uncharacterised protein [Brachyspira pilosicoli]
MKKIKLDSSVEIALDTKAKLMMIYGNLIDLNIAFIAEREPS